MTRVAFRQSPCAGFRCNRRGSRDSAVGNYTKTPCLTSTSSRRVKPHRSVQFHEPEFSVILQVVDLRRKSRRVWQPKLQVENSFVSPRYKELFFSGKTASPIHQVRFNQPFVKIESRRRSNLTRLTSQYNIILNAAESVDALKISPPGQSCPQESGRDSRSASCVQSGPSVSCLRQSHEFLRSNADEAQETTRSFFDYSPTPW